MPGDRMNDKGPTAYCQLAVANAKSPDGHDVTAIPEICSPICLAHHADPTSVPSVRPSVQSVSGLAFCFATNLTACAAVNRLRDMSIRLRLSGEAAFYKIVMHALAKARGPACPHLHQVKRRMEKHVQQNRHGPPPA